MRVSYKWLQSYFEKKLPEAEKLAELIEMHLAEVESMEKVGDDTVLDIKILPDRACYALCHRGIAGEVAAILGVQRKKFSWPEPPIKKVRKLSVSVEAPELCPCYMARVIENVTPKAQAWAAEHLSAIGQRSINPIVDGANLVMFDMNQPLHAFDADKVEGGIIVRRARKGEKITTLDGKDLALDPDILIIADAKAPLAIAGIKGGKRAEVTAETKNLILEAANFEPSNIRRASDRLGIKTDASKRFESRISPELAAEGMKDFSAYLFEMDKDLSAGEIIDVRHSHILKNVRMSLKPEFVAEKLGIKISEKGIAEILERLGIKAEAAGGGALSVAPPPVRTDLTIAEDIVEEVGRIYGYEKIPAVLPLASKDRLEINKAFYYVERIRGVLADAGFSEIMTSSFTAANASVEVANPLAEDKKFMRPSLSAGLIASLEKNRYHAPLLGLSEIKIFEIGKVFTKEGEKLSLGIAFDFVKNIKNQKQEMEKRLNAASEILSEKLGVKIEPEIDGAVLIIDLDKIISALPEPTEKKETFRPKKVSYKPFSAYPFVLRDIAVFVPEGIDSGEVLAIIKKESGPLLIKERLFDVFKKADKTSYAFNLVFQSYEKTLSDAEVGEIMDRVTKKLNANKGWQVR